MVTVSEIRYERSFVCVLLDSGEHFWLRKSDFPKSGLCEGNSYEYESILQTIRLFQYPRALNNAVAMLARRPCSRKEIMSRLLFRRFCEDVAELVLFKLEKEKLIDDRSFCEQWIQYRSHNGFGLSAIRRELIIKGIPEDMISDCLNLSNPESEEEYAVRQAQKYWKRIKPEEDIRKARQKVITALVRKGFDWDTARKACSTAENKDRTDN